MRRGVTAKIKVSFEEGERGMKLVLKTRAQIKTSEATKMADSRAIVRRGKVEDDIFVVCRALKMILCFYSPTTCFSAVLVLV